MINEYNTQREPIVLKAYGRNIQKLVNHIRSVPDKEKRSKMAATLIQLIRQLVPISKNNREPTQRMWDDLFIMAKFDLDISSPYNVPDQETLFKKPRKMEYPTHTLKYRHYGRSINNLVQEVVKKENPEERYRGIVYLGRLMKTFYWIWNRENIDNAVILKDIKIMSNNQLTLDLKQVQEKNLFERIYNDKPKQKSQNSRNNNSRKRRSHGGK